MIVFRLWKSCATVNWSKTNTVAIAFDSRKRERNLSYLVNFYSLKTGKLRTILSVFLLWYFNYLFIFFQNLVVYYARDDIKVFEALSWGIIQKKSENTAAKSKNPCKLTWETVEILWKNLSTGLLCNPSQTEITFKTSGYDACLYIRSCSKTST